MFQRNKLREASTHYLEALEIMTQSGMQSGFEEMIDDLSLCFKSMGNYERALEYNQEYVKAIKKDRDEKQIALTKIYQRQGAERLNQQRQKHEEEMAQKQVELGNSTLQLVAQTELLSDIRSDLLKIVRKISPSEPAAHELREMLKTMPCKAVDWEKFDTQFKSAHPGFTKQLVEKHPDLTATELRVCSLLRMNLTSEDIARLFCLSPRSVESHRFRIRKKLSMIHEEDLVQHLVKM